MALVNCPECGKEVSSYAEACPNCGCPKDVILESIKEEPEMTEEELAESKAADEKLRMENFAALDDLEEKFNKLREDTEKTFKFIDIEREWERKEKGKSWTWMDSGSMWWF